MTNACFSLRVGHDLRNIYDNLLKNGVSKEILNQAVDCTARMVEFLLITNIRANSMDDKVSKGSGAESLYASAVTNYT